MSAVRVKSTPRGHVSRGPLDYFWSGKNFLNSDFKPPFFSAAAAAGSAGVVATADAAGAGVAGVADTGAGVTVAGFAGFSAARAFSGGPLSAGVFSTAFGGFYAVCNLSIAFCRSPSTMSGKTSSARAIAASISPRSSADGLFSTYSVTASRAPGWPTPMRNRQ